MITVLLDVIDDTIFMLLFIVFFSPTIHLILRLIQRFIYVLKYKGERNVQNEIKKIKNVSLTILIVYLPVIFISIGEQNNETYMLLFFLSLLIAFYYILRSIIVYVQLSNIKNKLVD